MKIIQSEDKRTKSKTKTKKHLRTCEMISQGLHIYVIRVSEKEKKGAKKYLNNG